jgi:hypothetical protein
MESADHVEIRVYCFHLKNLKSHQFFPKLLSSSVNKSKLLFQTTGPMQIITKVSSDMCPIAQFGKGFQDASTALRFGVFALCPPPPHT